MDDRLHGLKIFVSRDVTTTIQQSCKANSDFIHVYCYVAEFHK